ncbi:MAG: serine hydrolase domain-containing protein [Flavobacterium sp.]
MLQKIVILSFIFFSFSSKSQNLTKIADSIRIKNNIPEMAFAVISATNIIEKQVIGFHKISSNIDAEKAKINDYFHLGSNTKAITGFIAATLVEQKKLNWNTKFFDVFPEWKKTSNKEFYDITLEDLLSHRAHIPSYNSGEEYQKLPEFKGSPSEKRKQFCEYILKNEPTQSNSEIYTYSNAGYSIAALMLEKATGKSWEVLIDDILSKKLKLKYKLGWPNRYQLNQPWGHWIENGALIPVPPTDTYHLYLAEPAGDISMPITDYAKFIQINLRGLSGSKAFIKSETYDFLHYGKEEYSIGWANTNSKKQKTSQHSGSDGTFFSFTQIDYNKKLAYIILINCATEEAQNALFDFLQIMKSKY